MRDPVIVITELEITKLDRAMELGEQMEHRRSEVQEIAMDLVRKSCANRDEYFIDAYLECTSDASDRELEMVGDAINSRDDAELGRLIRRKIVDRLAADFNDRAEDIFVERIEGLRGVV